MRPRFSPTMVTRCPVVGTRTLYRPALTPSTGGTTHSPAIWPGEPSTSTWLRVGGRYGSEIGWDGSREVVPAKRTSRVISPRPWPSGVTHVMRKRCVPDSPEEDSLTSTGSPVNAHSLSRARGNTGCLSPNESVHSSWVMPMRTWVRFPSDPMFCASNESSCWPSVGWVAPAPGSKKASMSGERVGWRCEYAAPLDSTQSASVSFWTGLGRAEPAALSSGTNTAPSWDLSTVPVGSPRQT
mmetsp:Transcript_23487/g.89229  ORF Transcript_23487/g.89229 Transcript_23487/m.89229 type:complete len:240 (-) Transcript_23487:8269-8988(-)